MESNPVERDCWIAIFLHNIEPRGTPARGLSLMKRGFSASKLQGRGAGHVVPSVRSDIHAVMSKCEEAINTKKEGIASNPVECPDAKKPKDCLKEYGL